MSGSLTLEDFGSVRRSAQNRAGSQGPGPSQAELEAMRLQAYEDGYKTGWSDALASQEATKAQISEELSRNLQDLGFSYHEAREQVVRSLSELVDGVFTMVLGEISTHALAARTLNEIQEAIASESEPQFDLLCHPHEAELITELLPSELPLSIALSEDGAVARGQVYLKFGTSERVIDMGTWVATLQSALAAAMVQESQVAQDQVRAANG